MKRFLVVTSTVLALAAGAMAQNMSTSWKHGSDRSRCEDLQITSSDYEIARSEQEISVDLKDAPQFSVDGSKNGGIYVTGWDQPTYKVTACKAAFGANDAEAKQILAGVNIGRNGAQLTASGPDQKVWTVNFIIRVPNTGDLTATTYNGPVDAREVSGKLKLTSHNGPVSIKRCTGDVTGETQNGPVTFTGKAGNIDLTTVNGPVDLNLESAQWTGAISAKTNNGPVSLNLPENFESAFLVEGGYGPMSCSSSICAKATKTNEHGNRRIEFGDSPRVKASTHNGPVSVASIRGDI
jgi:Putative adhesin